MSNKTIDRELGRRAIMQKIRRNTKHAARANKVRFESGKEQKYNFYENLIMLLRQSDATKQKMEESKETEEIHTEEAQAI